MKRTAKDKRKRVVLERELKRGVIMTVGELEGLIAELKRNACLDSRHEVFVRAQVPTDDGQNFDEEDFGVYGAFRAVTPGRGALILETADVVVCSCGGCLRGASMQL